MRDMLGGPHCAWEAICGRARQRARLLHHVRPQAHAVRALQRNTQTLKTRGFYLELLADVVAEQRHCGIHVRDLQEPKKSDQAQWSLRERAWHAHQRSLAAIPGWGQQRLSDMPKVLAAAPALEHSSGGIGRRGGQQSTYSRMASICAAGEAKAGASRPGCCFGGAQRQQGQH